MKYTYYPGCSLHSMAQGYDLSTVAVFQALGIELEEVRDWNCCGASSAHTTNDFLASALPLRNLILAEKQGHDVVAPCAACYNLLKVTDHMMRSGGEEAQHLNREMQEVMGATYQGTIQVRHVAEVLTNETVMKDIAAKAKQSLRGIKLASYYGCLLTRPPKVVSFEANPEQPVLMDRLVQKLGAQPVAWTHKTECCGAGLAVSKTELVVNLTGRIVEAAHRAGAEALVTACPLCYTNLDTRQGEVSRTMPVFFITELIGVALGLAASQQWWKKHIIDPLPLLRNLDLLSVS
ncbi:disulfide reductase [Clostridiales bacterium PH28_bin88]|nr:disulfide reductase [Clostridiales bacterium PH28_bin88]